MMQREKDKKFILVQLTIIVVTVHDYINKKENNFSM